MSIILINLNGSSHWDFCKISFTQVAFFYVLEHTKLYSLWHTYQDGQSKTQTFTLVDFPLEESEVDFFCWPHVELTPSILGFFGGLRHVVKCVVRCFQREPWSGHKDSFLHGLHCPISSSNYSLLSNNCSDFASLWLFWLLHFNFWRQRYCVQWQKLVMTASWFQTTPMILFRFL